MTWIKTKFNSTEDTEVNYLEYAFAADLQDGDIFTESHSKIVFLVTKATTFGVHKGVEAIVIGYTCDDFLTTMSVGVPVG